MDIITLFQGEMLFSLVIRTGRLRSSACYGSMAKLPFAKIAGDKWGSLRLPWPSENCRSQISMGEFVKTYNDATIWPIMGLMDGFDLRGLYFPDKYSDLLTYKKRPLETTIRFCRECALEQRQRYGLSWWMRDHNIPLCLVCAIHGIPLSFLPCSTVLQGAGGLPHEFADVSSTTVKKGDSGLLRIAKNMVSLCKQAQQLDVRKVALWIEETRSAAYLNKHAAYTWANGKQTRISLFHHDEINLRFHDSLTGHYYYDEQLAVLAFSQPSISDFLKVDTRDSAIRISNTDIDYVISLLLQIRSSAIPDEKKQRLLFYLRRVIEEQSKSYCAVTEILLLFYLDTTWINHYILSNNLCVPILTPDQVKFGLYVLDVRLSAEQSMSCSAVLRQPGIQFVVDRDTAVVPGWEMPFFTALLTHAARAINLLRESTVSM